MKWARQYASEIINTKDIETRREMLEKVPERFRAMVELHVRNAFSLRSGKGEPK